MKLESDKVYKFCTCGLSKLDPICDNSHKGEIVFNYFVIVHTFQIKHNLLGTKFKPIKFKTKKNQTYFQLCGCKKNKECAGPYCDGSHSTFDW